MELSDANERLVAFYKLCKGREIPEPFRNDPLTRELFTIIGDLENERDWKIEEEKEQELRRRLELAMAQRRTS